MTDQQPTPKLIATGGAITAIIPGDINEIYRIAQLAEKAGIASKMSPEQRVVAIMTGMEVGLKPMASLKWIAVINGIPSIWGDGAIALVRDSKLVKTLNRGVERAAPDAWADTDYGWCETERIDGTKHREEFSVAEAKEASLWSPEVKVTRRKKDGGTYETDNDSPWHRYPSRMLQWRATGNCLRFMYADALGGLSIAEEVRDMGDLHEQVDGTYAADAPARPQRSDYRGSLADTAEELTDDDPRAFEIYDHTGETVGTFTPGPWADEYFRLAGEAAQETRDALNQFIDNNADTVRGIREENLISAPEVFGEAVDAALKAQTAEPTAAE